MATRKHARALSLALTRALARARARALALALKCALTRTLTRALKTFTHGKQAVAKPKGDEAMRGRANSGTTKPCSRSACAAIRMRQALAFTGGFHEAA
eukprot:4940834-Pleurochrysis_carterae.AAC.5